jgi:hypothetical protein
MPSFAPISWIGFFCAARAISISDFALTASGMARHPVPVVVSAGLLGPMAWRDSYQLAPITTHAPSRRPRAMILGVRSARWGPATGHRERRLVRVGDAYGAPSFLENSASAGFSRKSCAPRRARRIAIRSGTARLRLAGTNAECFP